MGVPQAQGPYPATPQVLPQVDEVFRALQELELRLGTFEGQVTAIERAVSSRQISIGKARDDLAQVEAALDRLQCKGIDSVSTLELAEAQRATARERKRELTRRSERL